MHQDLKTLLELQAKDRDVMAVQAELDALNPEVETMDAEVTALESQVEAARARFADISERRSALETKIESYRVMQERRRQKLEWVRGAKEASALMAEIDLARSVMAKEEADWLRSSDDVQKAENVVEELAQQLEALRESQAPRRAEIAEVKKGCRSRHDAAIAQRGDSSKNVQRQLLVQYERIRKGRAPLAVYPLHDGACGHCYTAIPLHLRQQIQQNQGSAVCEACGVMIYIADE